MSLIKKLRNGLEKTRNGLNEKIDNIIKSFVKIDEDFFDELEEALIMSDVGFETTEEIIEDLKDKVREQRITDPNQIKVLLKEELISILDTDREEIECLKKVQDKKLKIIVVIGVNGVGKTTSIGKIAYLYKNMGYKTILAAGDTFRAGAIEQLDIWSKRSGTDIIKQAEGSDSAAVIYDAIQASKARNADVLICDTAGRLHTKKNLMEELKKLFRVITREAPEADLETLLVLDATTGQNAVSQAMSFQSASRISGIILTKLDGTAKGGIIITVKKKSKIPVKLIGVGEKIDDLQFFDAKEFIDALFG
jgi:fused signal recognition particle receptor